MKKFLLAWNVRLSAIASGFMLFYAGFQIGKYRFGNFFPPSQTGVAFLVLAMICLLWLLAGIVLQKEGRSAVTQFVVTTVVLVLNVLYEIPTLKYYFKGTLFSNDFFACSNVVFLFSILISVSHYFCAYITYQE